MNFSTNTGTQMTVAQEIKSMTKPLTYERANMAHGLAVKKTSVIFIGDYLIVWDYIFSDGSSLTCRFYA